jgi:chaperonin GroEL
VVYRPNVNNQRCFVLLPLRSPFLGYFEKIIKPAALEAGLTAVKADDIYGTRAVISDIWELIWTSKIAIAVVTDQNPNVNYELGMCHTLGVPTILVTEKAEDVPFDYRHRRYVRYTPREAGWEQKLFEDLRNTIKAVLMSPDSDEHLSWPYDTYALQTGKSTGRLIHATDSLDLIVRGAQAVRDSVATAFGPQGGPVSVTLPNRGQHTFRRGYLIARGVRPQNPLEERGAEHMRRLAGEIADSVGDATKTGILMSCSLIESGAKAIRSGSLPKPLTAGMQKAIDVAASHVVTEAKSVEAKHLQAIAQTATGSDQTAASLVVDALNRVGKDGATEVIDGSGPETEVIVQEGLRFGTGFLSLSFITDNERQECVLEDPYILLYEERLNSLQQILPIMEIISKAGKPLLAIAIEVTGEALATLVVNKEHGKLSCAAVKAPGLGDRRTAILQDIATLTGGKALLQEHMRRVEDVTLADLGRAQKVIITKEDTTIIGGKGKPDDIKQRMRALRRQIEATINTYDAAKLRERLAMLAGAIALIKCGGVTDSERTDNRYKLEAALFSCQSALENGYVLGGGLCYYRAKQQVEKIVAANESERQGINAVSSALEAPLRQLIQNSSVYNKAKLLNEIEGSGNNSVGLNAETERVEDLENAGVLDSAKALKEALILAVAHAKSVLTTGQWDPGRKTETNQIVNIEQENN